MPNKDKARNDVYLLDSDTTSDYLDEKRSNPTLRERIEREPPHHLWISIVTFEEIVKGLLSLLNAARKHPRNGRKVVEYFGLLQNIVQDLQQFQILPCDAAAEAKYQEIPANLRQQHSQDCHIAASAKAYDLTVVTQNTRHFALIPNLKIEDWTVQEQT
jgi:tRNA(fMet)-specific endonuclease VapC